MPTILVTEMKTKVISGTGKAEPPISTTNSEVTTKTSGLVLFSNLPCPAVRDFGAVDRDR
jgi:hypothetical protein